MSLDMAFLQHVADFLDQCPASITRVCSTPAHNRSVGGAPNSGHLYGKAADLVFDSLDELKQGAKVAFQSGFMGIEVDLSNNHLHLDEMPRIWRVVHTAPGQESPLDAWLTAEV